MLLTKEIEVTITPRNVTYYKNKGYNIPIKYSDKSDREVFAFNEKISVKIEDISKTSHQKIKYKCDNCGEMFETEYNNWNNRRLQELGDLCKCCARKIKFPKSMMNRYGCTDNGRLSSTILKRKQTNLERYGVEWAIASDEVKDNIRATMIERYGVENPMQNNDIKNKAMSTNQTKYGGNSPFCSEAIREKSVQTCLIKYGVSNAFQFKGVQEKARKTLCENGTVPSSKPENAMCELLCDIFGSKNCFPSYPVSSLSLDCLVMIDGERIDFEYDGQYWHKNRVQRDCARNAALMNMGYRIVRIKASRRDAIPSSKQIEEAVDYLVKGNHHITFIDMNK